MMINRYYHYNQFLKKYFDSKVQKISINGGFTCPNRDGSIGTGGCTYCNNRTFHPCYCMADKGVQKQLEEGIAFFSRKYPAMDYLAYFQSYTNTYKPIDDLKRLYQEALAVDKVKGIIIGTRPDCVDQTLLDYLSELAEKHFVMIEYGIESTIDQTLLRINRGHDYQAAVWAIEQTAQRGILCGAHIILGLPGESRDDMLWHANRLSKLPISTLKLHQLQLIKGTVMAQEYAQSPSDFHIFDHPTDYIELAIDFVERMSPNIVIERWVSQSPKELLIAPDWGIKNYEFSHLLEARMQERDSYQGKLYSPQTSR